MKMGLLWKYIHLGFLRAAKGEKFSRLDVKNISTSKFDGKHLSVIPKYSHETLSMDSVFSYNAAYFFNLYQKYKTKKFWLI